jgi:hypothetical protein
MSDQSAKLAEFLIDVRDSSDLLTKRDDIIALFPGITYEEWMRGFQIHDETLLVTASLLSGKPIDLPREMAAAGWSTPAA